MRGKRLELTGQIFGRLTVEGFSHLDTKRQSVWKCVCNCGKNTTVLGRRLKRGKTTSCGCYQKEVVRSLNKKRREDNEERLMRNLEQYLIENGE